MILQASRFPQGAGAQESPAMNQKQALGTGKLGACELGTSYQKRAMGVYAGSGCEISESSQSSLSVTKELAIFAPVPSLVGAHGFQTH